MPPVISDDVLAQVRPRIVNFALALLIASETVGNLPQLTTGNVSLVIFFGCIVLCWSGYTWARSGLAIWVAMTVWNLTYIASAAHVSRLLATRDVVMAMLQIGTLFMLYSPKANGWFDASSDG